MALRINNNISSLVGLRHLEQTDAQQARTFERLSTGLRINRGADDPAGLIVSERLRSEISTARQAVDNTLIGIRLNTEMF